RACAQLAVLVLVDIQAEVRRRPASRSLTVAEDAVVCQEGTDMLVVARILGDGIYVGRLVSPAAPREEDPNRCQNSNPFHTHTTLQMGLPWADRKSRAWDEPKAR